MKFRIVHLWVMSRPTKHVSKSHAWKDTACQPFWLEADILKSLWMFFKKSFSFESSSCCRIFFYWILFYFLIHPRKPVYHERTHKLLQAITITEYFFSQVCVTAAVSWLSATERATRASLRTGSSTAAACWSSPTVPSPPLTPPACRENYFGFR